MPQRLNFHLRLKSPAPALTFLEPQFPNHRRLSVNYDCNKHSDSREPINTGRVHGIPDTYIPLCVCRSLIRPAYPRAWLRLTATKHVAFPSANQRFRVSVD